MCAGLLVGIAVGYALWGRPPAESPSVTPTAETVPRLADADVRETSVLRDDLVREAARRRVLEERVEELLAEVEAFETAREGEAEPGVGSEEVGAAALQAPKKTSGGWIDEDVLLRAGFDPREVEALREHFEAVELRRLFVRDQATREGWVNKPRYHRRMAGLNGEYGALRDEYGTEAYDWILFASGRKNRVAVERVMQGSPAEDVGILAGDVIVTYDGVPIFDPNSIRDATTEGDLGETVAVDVQRDGESERFFVDRGPLGVGLDWKRIEPREPR
jgi:hypothetical protein